MLTLQCCSTREFADSLTQFTREQFSRRSPLFVIAIWRSTTIRGKQNTPSRTPLRLETCTA